MTVEIIAEFGSNPQAHDWGFDLFCAFAAGAGATHAKVQLWRTDVIYPEHMREAKRAWEFPRERLSEFVEEAHRYGLKAGASVFDGEAVQLVAQHCDFLKLAAREWANTVLIRQTLQACKKYGRPLYRSLPHIGRNHYPGPIPVITLHAIPEYPASMAWSLINVIRMARYASLHGPGWGWSSHTRAPGWLDCALAARLGTVVVEKHLALARSDPEGKHSLLPGEFAHMVRRVKAWAKQ